MLVRMAAHDAAAQVCRADRRAAGAAGGTAVETVAAWADPAPGEGGAALVPATGRGRGPAEDLPRRRGRLPRRGGRRRRGRLRDAVGRDEGVPHGGGPREPGR